MALPDAASLPVGAVSECDGVADAFGFAFELVGERRAVSHLHSGVPADLVALGFHVPLALRALDAAGVFFCY